MPKVPAIPDGYHAVTPYLVVDAAAKAIEFYTKVFGATELYRLSGAGGKVGHCELKIGDSHVMVADEHPEVGARGPKALGGSPVSLLLYVPDVDATVALAVASGAKLDRAVEDKFWGDRAGTLTDPFGHTWTLATHIDDVSPEEIRRRMAQMPQM